MRRVTEVGSRRVLTTGAGRAWSGSSTTIGFSPSAPSSNVSDMRPRALTGTGASSLLTWPGAMSAMFVVASFANDGSGGAWNRNAIGAARGQERYADYPLTGFRPGFEEIAKSLISLEAPPGIEPG